MFLALRLYSNICRSGQMEKMCIMYSETSLIEVNQLMGHAKTGCVSAPSTLFKRKQLDNDHRLVVLELFTKDV